MPDRRGSSAFGEAIPLGQEFGEDEDRLGRLGPGDGFAVQCLRRVELAQLPEQPRVGAEEVVLVPGIRLDQGDRLAPLALGREQAGP